VPVKLYSAVSKKTVRFNQLHDADGVRIQQKRVCPADGEEVAYEHIVKGYEISPDQYVVITKEELDALDPEKSRTIDIEDFVDLEEIDPLYYDHPYYMVPDTGAAKAYGLLLTALKQSKKVAIARFVMRQKEYLAAIRAADGVLTLETMIFSDELVPKDQLEELPEAKEIKASKREVEMAQQLIASLSAEFEPSKYHDTYRERVMDLIERKAAGEEISIQPAPEAPKQVPDLMAALEASIADAKGDGKPSKAASKANGAKTSKAKAATKKATSKKASKPRAKSRS
jgi:DNA end-binding protein Ku